MKTLKRVIDMVLRMLGYEVRRINAKSPLKREAISEVDIKTIEFATPYTMTSWERIYAVIQATQYIESMHIAGSIVECGVWRGGSMMAIARTLKNLGTENRDLYLFDTFEGMSEPTKEDRSIGGADARIRYEHSKINDHCSDWCRASLEDVEHNLTLTDYDTKKIHYIRGKVEDTIPSTCPDPIALLRLDTDWYASTHHELLHLFPRLVRGGIIIIDDYGHWEGARKAVDEYFEKENIRILLHRIDYTGRIGIKL